MPIPTLNATLGVHGFCVLLALTKKTLHGYDVREQVAYDSGSDLIMAPGTAYKVLGRLTREGLLERLDDNRYSLTPRGRRAFEQEVKRLEHAITDAKIKLGHKIF